MFLERVMPRIASEEAEDRTRRLRSFQAAAALALGGEWLARSTPRIGDLNAKEYLLYAGAFLLALPFLHRRLAAFRGLMILLFATGHVALTFPQSANHAWLGLLIAIPLALFRFDNEEESRWALGSLRIAFVVCIFYTGFQKLLHGYYFQGEVLAFYVSQRESYRTAFSLIMPAAEIERLASYRYAVGAGPFTSSSPLFLIASNASWIGEIILPIMLLFRRTRLIAFIGLIALIVAIEVAARELYFGAFFLMILFLFAPSDWNRKALPGFIAFYVLALANEYLKWVEMY